MKASGSQDPVAIRLRGMMERQVSHLVRLVNDLLEVSRITRGLIEVQREPLDLAFVLHSAIDTSRPIVDAAGHQLSIDLPDEPVTVSGDTVRLTQVFSNLLNNAANTPALAATSRSSCAERDAAPWSRFATMGSASRLTSSRRCPRCSRIDRSYRLAQGGLGIGLTLVRSLVAMHGGTVEARSEGVGAGSEFVVVLPAAARPPSSRLSRRRRDIFPIGGS